MSQCIKCTTESTTTLLLEVISIETPGTDAGTTALPCSDLASIGDFWTYRCFGMQADDLKDAIWLQINVKTMHNVGCWQLEEVLGEAQEVRPKLVQHSKVPRKLNLCYSSPNIVELFPTHYTETVKHQRMLEIEYNFYFQQRFILIMPIWTVLLR